MAENLLAKLEQIEARAPSAAQERGRVFSVS
jgi:hypothetical protein